MLTYTKASNLVNKRKTSADTAFFNVIEHIISKIIGIINYC